MFVNNTPHHPMAHLAQNLSQQLGGAIDPQSIMMLLKLVRSMRGGQAQGGLPQGGLPQGAAPAGAGLPSGGFGAGGAAGLCGGMSAGQRQQMHQLRRLLGPHFKPLFKQAMCGQLDPTQACQPRRRLRSASRCASRSALRRPSRALSRSARPPPTPATR